MDRIDRMRARQGLPQRLPRPVTPPKQPPAQPKTEQPAKAQEQHQQADVAMVQYQCGCTRPAKDLKAMFCQACQAKAGESRAARNHTKKLTRGARRADRNAQRLPDGAKFDVTYDATSQTWTGTLTIGETTFTATVSGVFSLLRKLDRMYHAYLMDSI